MKAIGILGTGATVAALFVAGLTPEAAGYLLIGGLALCALALFIEIILRRDKHE